MNDTIQNEIIACLVSKTAQVGSAALILIVKAGRCAMVMLDSIYIYIYIYIHIYIGRERVRYGQLVYATDINVVPERIHLASVTQTQCRESYSRSQSWPIRFGKMKQQRGHFKSWKVTCCLPHLPVVTINSCALDWVNLIETDYDKTHWNWLKLTEHDSKRQKWAIPPVRLGLSGRNSEKFRKDPGNALRAFPGIPLESTAGMPQTL